MCQEYVCGWGWILLYYNSNTFRAERDAPRRKTHRREVACQWKWFYPFHYAPFARDIAEMLNTADDAELRGILRYQTVSSRPFDPLTQLLAVLPPDSMGYISTFLCVYVSMSMSVSLCVSVCVSVCLRVWKALAVCGGCARHRAALSA